MPRHPPCALTNLHTTHNTKSHRKQRCSRPLYSSQATGRTTPPHDAYPTPTQRDRTVRRQRQTRSPNQQNPPTQETPPAGREEDKTNTPAYSLRTQQRAQATPHTTTTFPTTSPKGPRSYSQHQHARQPTNRCSTHEQPPHNNPHQNNLPAGDVQAMANRKPAPTTTAERNRS